MTLEVKYRDEGHAYWMRIDGGRWFRAAGASTTGGIAVNRYSIEQWAKRSVGRGFLEEPSLLEELAVNPDSIDLGNRIAEAALRAAGAKDKANRGTQMHKVLELTLLDQLDRLMTDQQRRDADVLRRTLDYYKLTPTEGLVEQIIAWPAYGICGRFDAVLQCADNRKVLTDLKSGPNAVKYPHGACVQLALYANAPHVSAVIEDQGDQIYVDEWRTMPPELDLERGYVLLVEPDADRGTLHEVNIDHGMKAGRMALEIVNWRKEFRYGKDLVREVIPADRPDELALALPIMTVTACQTLDQLRELWRTAVETDTLTPAFKALAEKRSRELKAIA